MAQEIRPIDISQMRDLRQLAEEVRRTQQPHVLRAHSVDIAMLLPVKKIRRGVKGRPTSQDDPLWKIEGIGHSGKHDVARDHDRYLAEWERSHTQ